MKRTFSFFVLMAFIMCAVPGAEARRINVVAGTEMIADVVRDLTKGEAEILSLVPAASCPGHHDVRAADIAFMKKADVVILHAWQQKQKHIADAIAAADPANSPVFVEPMPSWLVPANQMSGSGAVYEILRKTPGVDFKTVTAQYNARLIRVAKIASDGAQMFVPYTDTPVMASAMQRDFAASLGMDVVAGYGRAEDTAPADLARLVQKGKDRGVKVVIDNMQSGSEAGAPLAAELGVPHLVFSNFPGFTAQISTYEALYKYNCDLLLTAIKNGTAQ